jgi:hypothetical protein
VRATSPTRFKSGADATEQLAWGTELDASCVQTVAWNEEWRCRDGMHVMFNHLSTPFFLRQALFDDAHTSRDVPYAVDETYMWDPDDYSERVADQACQLVLERDAASPRFRGGDYTWAQSTERGLGIFLPDSTSHAGLFGSGFESEAVDGVSYADALRNWLSADGDEIHIEASFACP